MQAWASAHVSGIEHRDGGQIRLLSVFVLEFLWSVTSLLRSCRSEISVSRCGIYICSDVITLLGWCAALFGNSSSTFRDSSWVLFWRVSTSLSFNIGPTRCPETPITSYHLTLHKKPEEERLKLWNLLIVTCINKNGKITHSFISLILPAFLYLWYD